MSDRGWANGTGPPGRGVAERRTAGPLPPQRPGSGSKSLQQRVPARASTAGFRSSAQSWRRCGGPEHGARADAHMHPRAEISGTGRGGTGQGGREGPAIEGRYDSFTRWTRLFATNAAAQAFCEIPRSLRRDATHPMGPCRQRPCAARVAHVTLRGAVVKMKVKLVRAVRACASVLLLLLLVVVAGVCFAFCFVC